MSAQELEKMTYKELDELSRQLARDYKPQFKLPFKELFQTTLSPEQKANEALGERLRAVMDEMTRRHDTEEAKIFFAERDAGYEAAKAVHERRYATNSAYKAHVDDIWQDWARSEARYEACETSFKEVVQRQGAVHGEHRKRLFSLQQEYEARLLDLVRETQARLNNAERTYEKRIETLKHEATKRVPSLKLEYRERIRTIQLQYKAPLASLSREWQHAMDAKTEALHAAWNAQSTYMKAIGDNGGTFTPQTTKPQSSQQKKIMAHSNEKRSAGY